MEENIGIGHVVGELINVLVSKGIITQEDLGKEREATIKMLEENQRDEEVK